MNGAIRVGTDGREEIVLVESDERILEFLSVPGEKDCAGARTVSDAEYVAFGEGWAVGCGCERVGMRFESVVGKVADRILVPSCGMMS